MAFELILSVECANGMYKRGKELSVSVSEIVGAAGAGIRLCHHFG